MKRWQRVWVVLTIMWSVFSLFIMARALRTDPEGPRQLLFIIGIPAVGLYGLFALTAWAFAPRKS